MIATSQTVNLNSVAEEEKKRFIRDLYAVQDQIFQDVDIGTFSSYILRPSAIRTKIKIFFSDQQEPVGYQAVHLFEMRPRDNEIMAIFRAEAGLLRPYRRKHSTLSLAFYEFFRYKCLYPGRTAYYLGTLVHPSSYHLVFRHCHEMYPTHMRETPPDILQTMCEMSRKLGIAPTCPDNPLIVRVGWRVRNDREDLEFWSRCDKPDVNFFLKTNPGYREGEGLLTLVPITWKNLLWLFIRWMAEMCRRKLRYQK